MDSQAKRIRANPTPVLTCPLANPSTHYRSVSLTRSENQLSYLGSWYSTGKDQITHGGHHDHESYVGDRTTEALVAYAEKLVRLGPLSCRVRLRVKGAYVREFRVGDLGLRLSCRVC